MSEPGGTGYDIIDNDRFELGRQMMKERVAAHWFSLNWNRWKEYNTELNPTWTDPWFESDLAGNPAPDNDPDNRMLQNLYGLYCWLSWKGYNKYAMVGLLTSSIQESTMSGGLWEGGWHPYPGTYPQGWVGYDATRPGIGYNETYRWYSSLQWYDSSGNIAQWTDSAYDPYTQQTVSLSAANGSGIAVRKWKIKMERWQDPDDPEVMWYRPVYPLTWDYTRQDPAGYPMGARGGGYGLAQFTPWTNIVNACAGIDPDGAKHWQCNLTLQLMALEYLWEDMNDWNEHGFNANDPPGWYDPRNGNYIEFTQMPITWQQWRDGEFLPFVDSWCESNNITGEDADWCRRYLSLSIYRCCFLKATYADFNFQQKSLWIISAINYWEANGGWDVMDIPRPRDIKFSELDMYHLLPILLMILTPPKMFDWRKRRPKYVKPRRTLPF